ncbi:hypothetical protein R75471_02123 [Paraburkholderia domus]|uniref:hypothetical protein n=1 Tax=Paraburkholderia domus TaxID=2793075 RepID=UPI001B2273E4|nr:hypothetical protein [Paraburkholderia domus]CAE6886672.1 hypothetical protein R75471_02123 [Paraburkholderia domus]
MSITIDNDPGRAALQRELPGWTLSDRTVTWLWMSLRERDQALGLGLEGLDMDEFNSRAMFEDMANAIREHRLDGALNDEKAMHILPGDDLLWIEKRGRQVNWLLHEIDRRYETPRSKCPPILNQRDTVVALIDAWEAPVEDKQKRLMRLRADWNRQLETDRYYSWFKTGKEKQKCEAAWDWYQKEHGRSLYASTKFSKLDDILFFLDTQEFSLEERQFHIEKIKQELKRQQARANLKDKKQSNFALSEEVRDQLEGLVARYGLTRRQIIERLIRKAAINGLDGERAPDDRSGEINGPS